MSLLDKFKKKTKKVESEKPKKKVAKTEKEAPVKKQMSKDGINRLVKAYEIIKEPRITEKAGFLAEQNKYVFEVFLTANKIEIKRAIELIYNTKVSKVHIIHSSPKKRRLGKREGWRKGLKHGFKKAIVTLKKGEKIELLPK